jgi:hypothetical protein
MDQMSGKTAARLGRVSGAGDSTHDNVWLDLPV